jgi:hypothetical protein
LAEVSGGIGWDMEPSPSGDNSRSASVDCDGVYASLRCESLLTKRRQARADKLEQLYRHNVRRCNLSPLYGYDCRSAVDCIKYAGQPVLPNWAKSPGYVHCLDVQTGRSHYTDYELFWRQTDALKNIVRTPEEHLSNLKDVLDRLVLRLLSFSTVLSSVVEHY